MIRWGIVGFGDIAAKAVAPAIQAHAGSELVAICRRDPAELKRHQQAFDVPYAYSDYAEMLQDAALDAVYVATPVHLHAEQAIAALDRGLHTLVEKPMASTAREAEAMVERADQRGATLGVAYYHHFTPINALVRELVASGELGTLTALHGNASSDYNPLPGDPKPWRFSQSTGGGGPLMDVGSHRLETFHSLAGPAQHVAAFSDRQRIRGDVEDSLSLIVRYSSGAQATLSSIWGIDPARSDYEIWCARGHVHVPYARGDECFVTQNGETRQETRASHELHDLPLIEDFVAGVAQPARHALDGRVGLEVQRVIDAAYRSAADAIVVTL